MTDRYENIRKALEMGPTPGPWGVWDDVIYDDNDNSHALRHFVTAHEVDVVGAYGVEADRPSAKADAALIAACDPDTIRALLEERDALAASASRWDMVCNLAEEGKLPSAVLMDTEHMGAGALQMHIDAAIAAANGGGNG